MTPLQIRNDIVGILNSGWTTTDIAWEGKKFDPPNNASWIRPVIRMGETIEGEVGEAGIGIRSGVLIISIFTPPEYDILALTYATTIEALFRRIVSTNGVTFGEPNTTNIGIEEAGKMQINVSIPFTTFVGE